MIKYAHYLILLATLLANQLVAQTDSYNKRLNETHEYCISHKLMQEVMKDSAIKSRVLQNANITRKAQANKSEKSTIYKVPVVFHVLHNNGVENISNEQLLDAIRVLNEGFRAQNADIGNVQAPFQGLQADVEVEFQLATIAPNGQCFSGITHTVTPLTSTAQGGQEQVDAVIAGNDVYQGIWPHNQYLNIYVAAYIIGAAGYSFIPFTDDAPTAANMYFNGVFMLHNYTGSIGTSDPESASTIVHEVGHWLGLYHPWGLDNSPGDPASCNIDDFVEDTPLCIGVISCDLQANSCDDTNDPNNFSSWNFDVIDNVENFMDYSYCSKMFTINQAQRMRSFLEDTLAGRNNVFTASNLAEVGVGISPTLCKAAFSASKLVACVGDPIQFTDQSYNYANSWNWSFEGASTPISTLQNPSVSWINAGVYTVVLTVSDGNTSDSDTLTVTIVSQVSGLSYVESFENVPTLGNSADWYVYNDSGNPWEVTNTAAKTGIHSAYIHNFNDGSNTYDNLFSSSIDLSSLSDPDGGTFSFRYAYRKKNANSSDVLKVYFSSDCGNTWIVRKTLNANALSDLLIESQSWTPDQDDWVTSHVTNLTSNYWNTNFRYRFEFKSGDGNNIYIDDINIYAGPPSATIVGVNNPENPLQNVQVYPNPAEDELHLFFAATTFFEGSVCIRDCSGRKLQYQNLHVHEGNNSFSINTSTLSAGFYVVDLTNHQSGAVFQQPFMVK